MKDRLLAGTFTDFETVFDPFITAFVVDPDTNLTSLREAWDAIISYGRDGFAVEAAFAPAVYKNAHIIVSVVCENSEPEGPTLGNGYGGPRQLGNGYGIEYSTPVTDNIGVYIMAPNRPILRMLDLLVKSTLFSSISWMNENGVAGPIWIRTSDLAPVTQMMGKETVLKFVRKQTWQCHTALEVKPFGGVAASPKHILVHAAGTFVSSVPNPETRTVTPLDGTTQGRVSTADGNE